MPSISIATSRSFGGTSGRRAHGKTWPAVGITHGMQNVFRSSRQHLVGKRAARPRPQ